MAEDGTLTPEQAKAFYDRLGARQDWNRFYEDRAIERMIQKGEFTAARAVVEFGCGTGRIAERLLARYLPADATYLGLDISTTMVEIAAQRLAQFGPRARVVQSDGSPWIDARPESFDRFYSNYVFDLLSREFIDKLVTEARRVLMPGGFLCVVSLTHGRSTLTKALSSGWMNLWKVEPSILGGCRPIELAEFIPHSDWRILHLEVVSALGLSSEVLVAAKRE
jgi:ubiquinone/menaquinone biosynthesis C-methylase UbiE